MKPLPPALLRPKSSRYTLQEARQVWLHVYHGWPYDTTERTPAYWKAYHRATEELKPISRSDTAGEQRSGPIIRRRRSTWLDRGFGYESTEVKPIAKPAPPVWIDRNDLIALAAEHGVALDVDTSETTASSEVAETVEIPERKRGNKEIHGESLKVATNLMKDHPEMDQIEACRQAVEQCFPDLAAREDDPAHERKRKADVRKSKAESLNTKIRKEKARLKQRKP